MDCPQCMEEFGAVTRCSVDGDGWEEDGCSYHVWLKSFKWKVDEATRSEVMGAAFSDYLQYHIRFTQYTLPSPSYLFAQALIGSLPRRVSLGDRGTIERYYEQMQNRHVWIYTHVIERGVEQVFDYGGLAKS